MIVRDEDRDALLAFSKNAETFLESLANETASKNSVLTVETAMAINPNTEGHEIVQLLKKMAELGYGAFVVGRRGHPTRLVWNGARKEGSAIRARFAKKSGPTDGESKIDVDMISYPFLIREGLAVKIELPTDLTADEADRLAGLIKMLPLSL